jgi:hypothetical protein
VVDRLVAKVRIEPLILHEEEKDLEQAEAHPAYRRPGQMSGQGEWRFTLGAPGDDGREIVLHVFAFNLFV